MTNDMFGIDARRYAALSGLLHGGTCNPARWAGLRDAAPLALGDSLKPHTVGRAKTYRAVGACVRVRCAGICGGSTEGSAAGVAGEAGHALRLPPAPHVPVRARGVLVTIRRCGCDPRQHAILHRALSLKA
jgi:hypothetical protein